MIYVAQILSLLFAIYSGRHDAPACDKFAESGSSDHQQAVFHSNNWKMKAVVVMMSFFISFAWYWHDGVLTAFIKAKIVAFICWAIIWLMFDISLNAKRDGRNWDYLSYSNGTDRWLLKHFGKNAGEWKAGICVTVIIALNVLILFL